MERSFQNSETIFSTRTILIVWKAGYFDSKDCCQTHLGL